MSDKSEQSVVELSALLAQSDGNNGGGDGGEVLARAAASQPLSGNWPLVPYVSSDARSGPEVQAADAMDVDVLDSETPMEMEVLDVAENKPDPSKDEAHLGNIPYINLPESSSDDDDSSFSDDSSLSDVDEPKVALNRVIMQGARTSKTTPKSKRTSQIIPELLFEEAVITNAPSSYRSTQAGPSRIPPASRFKLDTNCPSHADRSTLSPRLIRRVPQAEEPRQHGTRLVQSARCYRSTSQRPVVHSSSDYHLAEKRRKEMSYLQTLSPRTLHNATVLNLHTGSVQAFSRRRNSSGADTLDRLDLPDTYNSRRRYF